MFAEIGNGHYIAATSWGVLLDYLSASIPLAGEIDCRGDIVQLQGLCRTMDEETFLPLRGDEVTNLDMAQRYINFSDLAFAILIEAVDKGFCSREGIRERNYRYGPGAFFRIGNYKPWIGFGARSWLRLGASPIWIIFLPLPENPTSVISERLVGFRTCIPQRCYDGYGRNDGRLLIPVLLRTGVDKKDIIKDAVDQIGELMAKLGVQISLITPPIPNQTDEIDEDPEYNPESETNE